MNYLLTFVCYGTRLPGQHGIVNREFNRQRDPFAEWSPHLLGASSEAMGQSAYVIDLKRAQIILTAMLETCAFRAWHVYSIHVRTNHVHAVLGGDAEPERMLTDLKAYASRKLNELGLDPPEAKRWARHGSTRYLWDDPSLAAAIRYVIDDQGKPMASYLESRAAGSPP